MVDDLAAKSEEMRGRGFVMVSPPKPAVAFEGREVAFFMSRNLEIFELVARS